MADVTIKLLWYRLTESTDNLVILWNSLKFLVAAGGTVLNYIFLFWIIIGFLTIIVITFLQNKDQLSSSTSGTTPSTDQPSSFTCIKCKSGLTASSGQLEQKSADSVSWLNQVLQWTNLLNSRWKDSLTDHLLSSMTEESKKIGGDLFVTFEAVLPAGDAPLLTGISVEKGDTQEELVLKGELQLSALQLTLTASDNSVSIHSNLLLILHLLKTEVNIILANDADSLSLTIKPGEMITRELQFSPYYQGVDCVADEKKLTHHVTEIITNIALVLKVAISPRGVVGDPPSLQSSSLRQQSTPSTSSVPPKPPRSIEDKKLMIKLIKATKLNKQNLAGMDAYCVVQVDQPYQTHSTSIAKNTVNPYWDEHFLFDMNSNTNQVTFRVYGNSKDTDDNRNCLGESVIEIEVLRYNHGIRLVLPLERRAIDMEPTHPVSGSVTIEAFFVDSAEFSSPESDDVFAQSVEPLLVVSDTGESAPEMMEELPSPTLQLPPGEDIDHRLSELEENTLGSNSSTRVGDKDGSAQSIGVIHNDSRLDSTLSIDMKNAEIITLQPQDSVTDLVMKEISNRHDMPSTIIITSGQGRSDDSGSSGTPSMLLDVHPQYPPQSLSAEVSALGGQISIAVPTNNNLLDVPKERKSRLSGLKKRFTKTKDKKARSHSVERGSGLDENRYLAPPRSTNLEPSTSEASLGRSTLKKKLGGSLRKLFKRRSSSKSRGVPESKGASRSTTDITDTLSIEGARPDDKSSRSSFEVAMSPPHHRTVSQQDSSGPPDTSPIDGLSNSYIQETDEKYNPRVSSPTMWTRHHSLPSNTASPKKY